MKKTNQFYTKFKLSLFEVICYITGAILACGSIIQMIIGAVSLNLPLTNWLAKGNSYFKKAMGLDMLWWGLIILAIVALAVVIVLLANAKTSDRDFEKAQRRALRLQKEEAPVVGAVVEEPKNSVPSNETKKE